MNLSQWENFPPRANSSKKGAAWEGIRAYWERNATVLRDRGFYIELEVCNDDDAVSPVSAFVIELQVPGASASMRLEFEKAQLGQNAAVDITTYCSLDFTRPSTTRRYMKWDPKIWETVDWFDAAVSKVAEFA